ncbi:MAG: phospho-sugar mutase [Bacteroidetes bacterium]|nr:phospho-sugar mutase [Bacteroidota bacterium]
MDNRTTERIHEWLSGNYDQQTKEAIQKMQAENPAELEDAFYKELEFGTGGMRGIMGVGTNRMNQYTVGKATQGFANYLKKKLGDDALISVVIAYDSRNQSSFFADITAHVFAANNIYVYLFESLRPTPELSYAIRYLKAQAGVVCTASHNPKEYNGYKAYWSDGAQLVPPHDAGVMEEVGQIKSLEEVKWKGNEDFISKIGKEVDTAYIQMAKGLSVHPAQIALQHDLKIVYTSIHGTGIQLVPQVLKAYGFTNYSIVKEQEKPDGNFPTVIYPNPEESEAMKLGLHQAEAIDADILCGTDPDADRVGIGVKDDEGKWILMNGNQTAVLAFSYLIEARKKSGLAAPNDMVIKTIVTSDMIDKVAMKNKVTCYNVLTGFKWIAAMINEKKGKENYIIGGEESFGLMVGDEVRDKDAVSAVAILCEMAAVEKSHQSSLFEKLIDLYLEYGFYLEDLIGITKKGKNGQEEISAMMRSYRENPPLEINGSKVVEILDYQTREGKNLQNGTTRELDLPKSNVLQFFLEDGSKISARPSGTEPKIKFYFSVHSELLRKEDYKTTHALLKSRIDGIIQSMKLIE